MPGIGIMGAVIGTIVAYMIAAILNFIAIKKYISIRLSIIDIFLKPLISVMIMTLVVYLTYNYSQNFIGAKLATVASMVAGAIIYGIALLFTGTITSRDFELLPKGDKISKHLKRIGLLRN